MNYDRKKLILKDLPHDLAFASINFLELLKLVNERTEVLEAVRRAIPKLKDASTEEISVYLDSVDSPEKMQYILNNVQGVLGEFEAGEYFESEGYDTVFPESLFNPGFDIALYKDGGLEDVVQIKTVSSPVFVNKHLEKYPDIPVYVTEDVYGEMDPHPNIHELDFSSEEIADRIDDTFSYIDDLDTPVMDTFIEGGVYALAFSTIINGFVLSKKGFSTEKFGELTKHAAKRTVTKSIGASIGSVLGPAGMIGMGYLFGKIYDSYVFDSQHINQSNAPFGLDIGKINQRIVQDEQIGLLASEARSMVQDSIPLGEYEASGMYNLIHQFNFMPEMIQPGMEMMYGSSPIQLPPIPQHFSETRKKAISIPEIFEIINDFAKIDEKAVINKLPEMIYQHTIFTNAYMDAATFGQNNESILALTDEIMRANGTGMNYLKDYLSILPVKNRYKNI